MAKQLTEAQIQAYLKGRGSACPFCQSKDIVATESVQADGCTGTQECECEKCGESWIEEWALTGVHTRSNEDDDEDEDESSEHLTLEEYAAQWGDGGTTDGCMFYNFSSDGRDREFLEEFIPAVDRTIKRVEEELANPEVKKHSWTEDDLERLKELKAECESRMAGNPAKIEGWQGRKEKIVAACKATCAHARYTMELTKRDAEVFIRAFNQGIDGHLEGCTDTKHEQRGGKLCIDMSPEDLSVIIRRLEEIGTSRSDLLAEDILRTLGLEE